MNTKLSTNYKFNRMFLNILSIFVILAMVFANTGFAVQAAQRVLPGDWDGRAVRKASILLEPDGFKMWYDGVNFFDQTQIGLATSADGISWIKYSDNPVLIGGPEAWDSSGEHAPFVMKDGDIYKMWYEGLDGTVRQLGYATSPDGITWTKYEGNPVLQAGPEGYDQDVAGHGSVLYDDGMYKLWYHAIGDQGILIAYATSPDGINWAKEGPVLWQEAGVWDEGGLWGPSVLKVEDTYWMWYSAGSPIYPASIGAATSPNGVDWTRVGDAPVVTIADNHIGDPNVIFDGGIFKMWFNNFSDGAIYYTESSDGVNWSNPSPALLPGVLFPLEGWHDGSDGEADPGACVAFGWSADPDDRDRDVQIRVFSDGGQVAEGLAQDYGEDMEANNICPGGTCRFTINLWDLISHDEEHEITVQAYDEETADWWNLEGTPKSLTCVTPPPPNPWLIAFPENDAVEGWEFPEGAIVSLSINDITDPDWTGVAHITDWGDPRTYVRFDFGGEGGYDLKIGDMVTLTDEVGTSTIHEVRPLSISGVDMDTDIVAGTANVGAQLQVWAHGQSGPPVDVTASDGTWQADLTDVYDITHGTGGRAQIMVDGNATAVDWNAPPPPPSPWLTAFPEWDFVEGFEWPTGATVHLTIDDPATGLSPDFEGDDTAEPSPWGDPRTYVSYDFAEAYELKPGDLVSLSDGVTERVMVVQNLSISSVDPDTNTVAGMADPDAVVNVWPHETGEQLAVTTDSLGLWQVDLIGAYDIVPGSEGRAEIRDELYNGTAVDWKAPPLPPSPWLTAFPELEYVESVDWSVDLPVHLAIDDPNSAESPDYQADTTTMIPDWEPNPERGWAIFPLTGYDLKVGDQVVMTGGGFIIEHVVRNLVITSVDIDADIVTGTADVGAVVEIWPHGYDQDFLIEDTAEDGTWFADFGALGFHAIEETGGRAWIIGEGGNATAMNWSAPPPPPSPFIAVSITQHWFWVNNYAPNTLVTFSIYDNQGDENPILEFSKPTDELGNLTIDGWAHIWNPEPGDYIVATDGTNTKDLILEYITLDVFDPENDLVSGHAVPGREIGVGVGNETGEQWMNVFADDSAGEWVADFTTEGFEFDITENSWAGGHVNDEDGDVTAAHNSGPPEPPAWFTVFPEQDAVEGWDFPLGASVHLTIDDPTTEGLPDYEQDEAVMFAPWGSWQLWVWFDFAGKYNLKAGDVVTLSYGETVRTHTVQNLTVSKVNPEDDMVKGVADPGAGVNVWPHATGQQLMVTANPKGKWDVSFTGTYDLKPGDGGRAEVRDEMGNATAVDWHIPKPRIVASITEDWFYLQEFTPSTVVSFTVYKSQGGKPIWKGTATTDGSGFAWIDAEGRWNLEPGNYLVVQDGQNTKDLVIEGFTFDVFNVTNGQLSGTAPEPYGRNVWVGIGWENDGWSMDVTTDGTGAWIADFGAPVPSNYHWVAAQIFDTDGDASELRPASQIIFLRPRCGDTYTVQANTPLELRYGSWVAIGEDLAQQNADLLTVELALNGEIVTGEKQPVVPSSEIPCGTPREDAYGVFYVAEVGPLTSGTYHAEATWSFDQAVTDGYDADGDGVPEWYGPGEIFTREFTIIVK